MDYKQINLKLKDFNSLRHISKPVHREVVKEIDNDGYGEQGESNEIYEVYDIGLPNGLFVKLQIGSDSYGHDDRVTGVTFVQAQEKKVTVYEYNEQ